MLTALKAFLKKALIPVLYFSGFGVALASIFREAKWGFFLLVFLIPQPNIWYKLQGLPFGKDFLDILFFSVVFGIILQGKGWSKTANTWIILLFIFLSYCELWNSSFHFNLPLPITTANGLLMSWKNYAQMIFLYFLVLSIVKDERGQKELLILLAIVILIIVVRSYRGFSGGDSFSYEKRYGGPFEFVGLGANHLGAFIAYTCSFLMGLFILDSDIKRKWLCLVACVIGLHPLFFAYSRGAYLAVVVVLIFYGLLKSKSLLVLLMIVLCFWQTVLPVSVVDRITMTTNENGELEESAELRLGLWETSVSLFEQSPIVGVGYDGFRLTLSGHRLTDTHNFYLKTLCEQGVVGLFVLLMLLFRAFLSGYKLYKYGESRFNQGLGLGFMGSVLAMSAANVFGDRFSYFALGGYFWIFWGLVDRGILLAQEKR